MKRRVPEFTRSIHLGSAVDECTYLFGIATDSSHPERSFAKKSNLIDVC